MIIVKLGIEFSLKRINIVSGHWPEKQFRDYQGFFNSKTVALFLGAFLLLFY